VGRVSRIAMGGVHKFIPKFNIKKNKVKINYNMGRKGKSKRENN
jgi:hypothetical protein